MLVFLALYGINLQYTQDELSTTILGIADGSNSPDDLLEWILTHQLDSDTHCS